MTSRRRNPKITPAMVTLATAKHQQVTERLKKEPLDGIRPWPVIEARRQQRAEKAMRAALEVAFEFFEQEQADGTGTA